MSNDRGDYEVGYGKPPRAHRFTAGNQAARKRRRKTRDALSLSDVMARAVNKRVKVKRGNELVMLAAGEVLVERLVRAMTTGSMREMAMVLKMVERHAPQLLTARPEVFKVEYHRAEGSTVELPPADLWDDER